MTRKNKLQKGLSLAVQDEGQRLEVKFITPPNK